MMHEREKSDPAVVAVKPVNNAERSAAESVEPRAGAEGNASQHSTGRAQKRATVSQGLERIRQVARQRTKEKFTTLLHHISTDHLGQAFLELKEDAAPGVDGLTWRDYEADLERNLEALHARVHRGAYRALPGRRVYIPKPDGRQRPLAVAALEDKIVQRATTALLNAIYEEDFLGFSYGFRPGRGTHNALDALCVGIDSRKVNYILDADIRSFFDEVSKDWLIRFVEHRIGDKRIIRLIQKWLKAGILEDGIVAVSDKGTGQGAVISPLLANIYLHYALDLWAERWRKREATGDMIIVRYADDIIVGFEHEADARRFLEAMRERLGEFALSLHPDKTRLIEFGRHAAANRDRRGLGKPETFNFLGFTFICGKSRRGKFLLTRPHAGEAASHQAGVAAAQAPADPGPGEMAETGRQGLLQLSCRADQQSGAGRIPLLRHRTLAAIAQATQSERRHDLGADYAVGQRLAPETGYPSSMAKNTLRRHAPKVGEAMGRAAEVVAPSSSIRTDGGCPVAQVNDLSRSLTAFDPISTLVVVVEMSKASWLVSGVVPGVERQPLKKLEPDATALFRLIERGRNEGVRAGRPISRIALAYEAGRDGFWLARWLIARGIEAHVIHSASVAVSRERKGGKTDRLDAAMLMRVFLGWLRGERGHCGMVAIPTMEEEDARRPSRERESLGAERLRLINRMKSALARLGIRGFKPHLRKAPERLAGLRTAEGTGLPANIIEEFRRDMARLALLRAENSSLGKARAGRARGGPPIRGRMRWCGCSPG